MKPSRLVLFAAAVLSGGGRPASAGAAVVPSPAPYPWGDKLLTAPPREVAAAAKTVTDATASYVVMFEERADTVAPDGRLRSRERRAYKILTEAAVREATVATSWAPWHESEPEMRVRVVTADGKAYTLDPKTIEASGSGGPDASMFTDRRQLRAALPGAAVGAVVEEEVTRESHPVVAGLGMASGFYFGGFSPVLVSRLILDVPRGFPVHLGEPRGQGIRVTRTETADRTRVVYEAGPLATPELPDEGWPDDVPVLPSVRYSTGPTWRDVAARYAEIVDRQIAGADVAAWIKEARTAAHSSRNDLIARLVARLHREVRYTGVEFADASIIPRRPAEVLARGYGDCKDKAAMLVALLRAAGVPANVALLRVGGLDVDPKLPALDGFDHAIVYVAPAGKAPALWIDATNPYTSVGELPGSDVDRHALIAAPRTDALVTIPAALAGASRVRETRRIVLEESGHPRVIERTEAQGGAARGFRQSWSTTAHKDLEDAFTSYVKEQYAAKALTRFDVGAPADLSKPVRLELEASDAEIGNAWEEGAQVLIRSGETLTRLPPTLRASEDEHTRSKKPRAVDFVIREPYVYDLRYEIVPPHGFAADPLPEGTTRAIGTSSLRSSFSLEPGGTVVALFTFDSGKARLTPAEYERFRADIKDFWKSGAASVQFHSTGAAALGAGKVREAIAIFRKLDAEHPHKALHARQIAEAVLAAGLGLVARDQAKRSLAADPKSAEGEVVLGWTLEHDLIGRRFHAGADLAGAEQAYRRAIALDPKHVRARASLAILLEHDAAGQHTYPAARRAEVEKIYDALEKEGEKTFAINHTMVLLYQERFKTVIERTRIASATNEQSAALFAAVAASQGTAAAQHEASSRLAGNDQRPEILRLAGAELMRLRRYSEAAAFFDQAGRESASNGAALHMFAERVRHARRFETVKPDLTKPGDVARALFIEVFKAQAENRVPAAAAVSALVAPEFVAELAGPDSVDSMRRAARSVARETGGVPLVTIADMIADAAFDAEGRPGVGYRVRVSMGDPSTRSLRMMVRADPEGPRVVAVGEDRQVMAREALRLLRARRLDAARTWLDWILEGETLGIPTDALSGSLFARVWSQEEADRTAEGIELAAAVMLAYAGLDKADGEQAIPILRRALAASPAGPRKDACALALALALRRAQRAAEADPLSADLYKRHPRSQRALNLRADVLEATGRLAEAVQLLEAEAKARPDDHDVGRLFAHYQNLTGKLADAEASWTRLAASPRSVASDHNELAWVKLCRGNIGDATLSAARRGVELSGRHNPTILHTLAAVLAERDQPEEAREVLIESLDERASDELLDHDRYVLGRIAESHAFLDTARSFYRDMKPPAKAAEMSSYQLAQRRLARLGTAGPGGAAPAATATKSAR